MKISSVYTCSKCSFQSPKWLGKCPGCEAWNSFAEEEVKKESALSKKIQKHARTPEEFSSIIKKFAGAKRLPLGLEEFDRVLGGGIVPGELMLLTGEPGIGKSTLTLQIADKLCALGKRVLYISGEESEEQISLRGARLKLELKNLALLNESNLETALATAAEQKADFLIVDSIQVMSSANIPGGAGSVSQVRLCAEAILEFAKPKRLPVLLTGHVTKDGTLAGPRVLEHLVDGVFMLEGDRYQDFRILRGMKNRFGSTNEIGVFEMTEGGLAEVKNPSAKFMEQRSVSKPGVAVVCTIEGTRPLLVEVEALVSKTRFGYPVRRASGFDVNRLNLLIAVIEQHCNIPLGEYDVYVNVVGGMKLDEPAADLGIVAAIVSSWKKKPISKKYAFAAEVSLSGEIRSVQQLEKRQKEAQKLGFSLISKSGKNGLADAIETLFR